MPADGDPTDEGGDRDGGRGRPDPAAAVGPAANGLR
jgi:hypothetical protein